MEQTLTMTVHGNFFRRNKNDGREVYELVLDRDTDLPVCRAELEGLGVDVSVPAMFGHLALRLEAPEQWELIGGVVAGGIEELPK